MIKHSLVHSYDGIVLSNVKRAKIQPTIWMGAKSIVLWE